MFITKEMPELPGSDKLSREEYLKEDLSRMQNLVNNYMMTNSIRMVPYNYEYKLDEFINEIVRDPRNFALIPDHFYDERLTRITGEEYRYFWKTLMDKLDPDDMRNKIERMMLERDYKNTTLSEHKAFHLFMDVRQLPNVDGYKSITPEVYFGVYDKIYRGHKKIREMDAERDKYQGNLPSGYERKYQRELADVVIGAPTIFWELPPEIKDNLRPPNHFYERLVERMDVLEKYQEEVEASRLAGEKITKEMVDKENLLYPVKDYVMAVEKYIEEQLEQDSLSGKTLEEDDWILNLSEEEMKSYSYGNNIGISEDDLNNFYKQEPLDTDIPPETVYPERDSELFYYDDINIDDAPEMGLFMDDDNFVSMSKEYMNEFVDNNHDDHLEDYENYVFEDKAGDEFNVSEYLSSNKVSEEFVSDERLEALYDDWYDLNNKLSLSNKEIDKMMKIEMKVGEIVAQNQSLYITVPAEMTSFSKGNNPFFESFLKTVEDNKLPIDLMIDSDVKNYQAVNKRWSAYHAEDVLNEYSNEIELDYGDDYGMEERI